MKNLLFIILSLLCFDAGMAQSFRGRVSKLNDGDTFHLRDSTGHVWKIRLYGIDAPEMTQDFGPMCRIRLDELTRDRIIRVDSVETDRYKRIIGMVYVGDTCINLRMVAEGYAWHYVQYARTGEMPEKLKAAQAEAQRLRIGLWARPNPISPWHYRHPNR